MRLTYFRLDDLLYIYIYRCYNTWR